MAGWAAQIGARRAIALVIPRASPIILGRETCVFPEDLSRASVTTIAIPPPSPIRLPTMGATLSPVAPMRAIPVPQRKLRAHVESLVVAEGLMSEVMLVEMAGGMAAVFSTRSPQKSTPNEDVAAVLPCSPHHGVLAVADGLGGHAGGERASKLTIDTIQETIQDALLISPDPDAEPLRPAILDGIEAANAAVRAMGTGAATTLSLVEIQGNVVRAYQVGDSAILLAGQRGKLKYQTIAHSPIGYAVEGRLPGRGRSDPPRRAAHDLERDRLAGDARRNGPDDPDGRPRHAGAGERRAARQSLAERNRRAGADRSARPRGRRNWLAVAQERMNARRCRMPTSDDIPSKPDDLTIIAFRPQC